MLSNSEIAASTNTRAITEIAANLGVLEHELIPYGRDIAKIHIDVDGNIDHDDLLCFAVIGIEGGDGIATGRQMSECR